MIGKSKKTINQTMENKYCPQSQLEIYYDLDQDYLCLGCYQFFCQHCFQTRFHYIDDFGHIRQISIKIWRNS